MPAILRDLQRRPARTRGQEWPDKTVELAAHATDRSGPHPHPAPLSPHGGVSGFGLAGSINRPDDIAKEFLCLVRRFGRATLEAK